MRHKLLLLTCGCATLLGLWLLPARRRPLDAVPSCHFDAGTELGYRLRTAADANGATKEVTATLRLLALPRPAAEEWLLGGVLSEVRDPGATKGTPGLAVAADLPFLVKMASDCRVADLGFLPAMPVPGRRQVQALLKAMEVLLPDDLAAQRWVRTHEDGVGRYGATYLRQGRDEAGHFRIARTRQAYSSRRDSGPVDIDVVAGDAEVLFDGRGAWLRRLTAQDRLRFRQGQRALAEVSARTELVRDDTLARFPVGAAELAAARFSFGEAALREDPAAAPVAKPLPQLSPEALAADLQATLRGFRARLLRGDEGAVHESVAALAEYLRAHPEAARALVDLIRRGELPDDAHAAAILALEVAGTPQAQAALGEMLTDSRMQAKNRMRAASALPDVPNPTGETVDALLRTATARTGGDEERAVATTALLAMGTMSSKQEAAAPAVADRLRGELHRQLQGARDAGERTEVLDAVANTGDERFAKELAAAERDDTPMVREHAARAFARMDAAVREPALLDWFSREPAANVRRAIAETLAQAGRGNEGGAAGDAAVEMAARRLPLEPEPRVRAALIDLLGAAAARSPLAKGALIAQFQREKEPELLALIGRYCSVEELRR